MILKLQRNVDYENATSLKYQIEHGDVYLL